jgi:pimeloyl-ACP methyl ester carboxylesterase
MTNDEFETARIDLYARHGAPIRPLRLTDRAGRTIYALEKGSGPPVIILHGGGGDASQFATWLRRLPADRRYIVVDRPGHGLSYSIDYTGLAYRDEAARFVADIVTAIGADRVTLVGNSMGGFFSLAFALAEPNRVRQLVLLGAPAGVDRWVPPMLRLMGLRGFNRLLFRMMRNPTPAILRKKLWKRLLVADASKITDEMLEVQIAASKLPGAELGWRTLLESFLGLGGVRPSVLIRDEVSRLDVPTTFVWGDRDAFAAPTSGEGLVKTMPRARLITIADAGHLPWLDDGEACAKAVGDALGAAASCGATTPAPAPAA